MSELGTLAQNIQRAIDGITKALSHVGGTQGVSHVGDSQGGQGSGSEMGGESEKRSDPPFRKQWELLATAQAVAMAVDQRTCWRKAVPAQPSSCSSMC